MSAASRTVPDSQLHCAARGARQRGRRSVSWFVGACLAVHTLLLAWGGYVQTPTVVEVFYLPAGLAYWQLGRFDLQRVNPPLVAGIAAVPVLLMEPATDWTLLHDYPGSRTEWRVGPRFLRVNGARAQWLFTIGRWTCIPFSLIGAWCCFRWAADLFGSAAGCLALMLWCTSPNIIAHGQLVTTDVPAASLGLLASYMFWRWMRRRTWRQALCAGLALGFAELAKMTWLVLYILWPILWLSFRSRPLRTPSGRTSFVSEMVQMAGMFVISVYLINAAYLFDGSFTPLGAFQFVSRTFTGLEQPPVGLGENRFRGSLLEACPVPVPRDYLLGLDTQQADFESSGWKSYVNGQWRSTGWWYYYLYGLAIKGPLGTWFLIALASLRTLSTRPAHVNWYDESCLLGPALIVLCLISAETGFSHHLRYAIPALPFLFVWAGKLARRRPAGRLLGGGLTVAAVAGSALSSLFVFPHGLSYFNELVGGPRSGHAHLLNSNIDWGQDLTFLKRWLDRHPEAHPIQIAYFGKVDPREIGIRYTAPPCTVPDIDKYERGDALQGPGLAPGWYAVSVNFLRGTEYWVPDGTGAWHFMREPCFTCFQKLSPVARAGYSINIYHVDVQQADRVRRELALPELKPQNP